MANAIDTAALDSMITFHSLAETLAFAVAATEPRDSDETEFGVIEFSSVASATVAPASRAMTVRA